MHIWIKGESQWSFETYVGALGTIILRQVASYFTHQHHADTMAHDVFPSSLFFMLPTVLSIEHVSL